MSTNISTVMKNTEFLLVCGKVVCSRSECCMFVSYQQNVGQNHSIHVKRNPFENVAEFDYLGTALVN
jgi:hypothetical protein